MNDEASELHRLISASVRDMLSACRIQAAGPMTDQANVSTKRSSAGRTTSGSLNSEIGWRTEARRSRPATRNASVKSRKPSQFTYTKRWGE